MLDVPIGTVMSRISRGRRHVVRAAERRRSKVHGTAVKDRALGAVIAMSDCRRIADQLTSYVDESSSPSARVEVERHLGGVPLVPDGWRLRSAAAVPCFVQHALAVFARSRLPPGLRSRCEAHRPRAGHRVGQRPLPWLARTLVPDRPQRRSCSCSRASAIVLAGHAAVGCGARRAADRRSFQVLQAVRRRRLVDERRRGGAAALAAVRLEDSRAAVGQTDVQLVGVGRCLYARRPDSARHVSHRTARICRSSCSNGVTRACDRSGHVRPSLADLDAGEHDVRARVAVGGEQSTRATPPGT